MAMASVRFVQGWIYWGGGSRRFIYAPSKLDPSASQWMAYKFQTAMPGALFGLDHIVSWLLQNFVWLYAGVIVFSLVELVAGAMLIVGAVTRVAAAASVCLSFVLMLLFGWQGATCIDEWTMAACNFAMGMTLLLAGGGAWSFDSWLARSRPSIGHARWFQWGGGATMLPLSDRAFARLAAILLTVCMVFVVGTYSYFRGSVVTPYHSGPVSPTVHHWALSDAMVDAGQIRFQAYINAGTPEAPSHIVQADLRDASGQIVQRWDAHALSQLGTQALGNDYAYQKIHAGPYGLVGPVGAKATVALPLVAAPSPSGAPWRLILYSVGGHDWSVPVSCGTSCISTAVPASR